MSLSIVAFHLACLSMGSLFRKDTYLHLLIELESRNPFFKYFTHVSSKTEVTCKMVYLSKWYYFSS